MSGQYQFLNSSAVGVSDVPVISQNILKATAKIIVFRIIFVILPSQLG
jgi:hypothetical protein